MLAREEYIGVIIKGFYFDRNDDVSHVPGMDRHIDESGKIISIGQSKNTYRVKFPTGGVYSYPADKVHEMFPQTSIDLKSLFNENSKL